MTGAHTFGPIASAPVMRAQLLLLAAVVTERLVGKDCVGIDDGPHLDDPKH